MRPEIGIRSAKALARPVRDAGRPRRRLAHLIAALLVGALPLGVSEAQAAPADGDLLVAQCLSRSTGTADAAEAWVDHCREQALEELGFRSCMATVPRSADAAELWAPLCREADPA